MIERTIRIGDRVICNRGEGVLRSILPFDGGRKIGVDIEIRDDEDRPVGFVSGCPIRLEMQRHEQ